MVFPGVFADKVFLIVLDDIWNVAHAEPLINALGPSCRLLITTRDGGIGSSTFSELKAERNAFQECVFPHLRELCRSEKRGREQSLLLIRRYRYFLQVRIRCTGCTEKTKIIHARKKGVEFLGFHFNGRWKRPRDKARKRFREEIRQRTRRQQPKNLEMVIKSVNPVIRGWGNYFKDGMVKRSFGELDGYIRGRLRSFEAKKRTLKILVFGIHPAEFAKMGLVSLSSMLDDTISCNWIHRTKAEYRKSVCLV